MPGAGGRATPHHVGSRLSPPAARAAQGTLSGDSSMSEQSNHHDGRGADSADLSAAPLGPPPQSSFRHKAWQVFQVVQARLRFIALLVVLGLVLGSWGTLTNYWEKWTRSGAARAAASSDVEYF